METNQQVTEQAEPVVLTKKEQRAQTMRMLGITSIAVLMCVIIVISVVRAITEAM